MQKIEIRQGTLEDVDLAAEIHAQSRRDTYRGMIAQEHLDAIDATVTAANWRKESLAGRCLFIATCDGTPAGFAYAGPGWPADPDGIGWLHNIHVYQQFQGTGAGQALLAAAVRGLRDLGYKTANLWVLTENSRARRFYEREGWTLTGNARIHPVAGAPTPQVEYACSL